MEVKDSGKRRTFETGAQRDRGDLKPRPDLIDPYFMMRFGLHLAKGAEKYSDWNWRKGMPLSDWIASAYRHLLELEMGMEDEDHAAAVAFNVMGFMVTKQRIKAGDLPKDLDDLQDFSGQYREVLDLLYPNSEPEYCEACDEPIINDECGCGFKNCPICDYPNDLCVCKDEHPDVIFQLDRTTRDEGKAEQVEMYYEDDEKDSIMNAFPNISEEAKERR